MADNRANLALLAELTDSAADFATGQFDQPMDDILERYRIELLPDVNSLPHSLPHSVRFAANVSPQEGATVEGAAVELAVVNGALSPPAPEQGSMIARVRDLAASLVLADYDQRVAVNLGQSDTNIDEQMEMDDAQIPVPPSSDERRGRTGAMLLTLATTTYGNIASEADRDWYRVELTAGRLYRFAMDRSPGSRVDPIVRLFPEPTSGAFIADNNGASPGQAFSDARLYYRAMRTGLHDIQVTTATADRDVNDVDYIGDYSLLVSEVAGAPPASSTPAPILASGQTLTRDIADYELVWSDEFDSAIDDNLWKHAPYYPGAVAIGGLKGVQDDDGTLQSQHWDINTAATLRLTSHAGLQVLRQAISYPRYSGLRGQAGWNIDSDGNWIIPQPDGTALSIGDGYLPAISDARIGTLPDIGDVVGSSKGFWGSRVSTKHKVHTRYGYYELYIRYKEFTDFQGFRSAWWLDGQNYWATSGNRNNSLRDSVFNGQEIDIGEVQSEDGIIGGRQTPIRLRDWSVVHINSTPNVRSYRVKVRDIDTTADFNRWHRLGIEWTPTDICFYRDGKKEACASNACFRCSNTSGTIMQNGSSFEARGYSSLSEPIISHRPQWIIISIRAGGWHGGNIIPDHHERMKDGLEAVVYVDYMRVYKPRDRYGDLEPDNHLFRNNGDTVNSEADLRVRP